jgi:hypothetical protein
MLIDCNDDFRAVEMADRKPGGQLVSKVRVKGGLVPRVSQCRSLDLSMLCPVEETMLGFGRWSLA